ncbi:MAG: thiamine-phosphate synthase [Micavibrio sp.]|nr:MAG: thiamine-phosphate synthase [Micavibrio sp.]
MSGRKKFDPSIYFILDPGVCGGRDPYEVAQAAIKGGITMLQLREKTPDLVQTPELARRLVALTGGSTISFIVNDHVALAREVGADGVHLGQGDTAPAEARDMLGAQAIIGLTAFERAHLEAIDPGVVDYVGTGPFYETKTDKGKSVLGPEKFAELAALSPVPVVGIGGITPGNAGAVINAGANGVAMMRAISEAEDPEAAARKFVIQLASRSAGGGYMAGATG